MKKNIILKTHIERQRHSAHYETAMIDLRAKECDLNPLISFEEFYLYGPVFQPSPNAGIIRLTLLLSDTAGTLHVQAGDKSEQLKADDLFCMNSGSGVLFEERVSPQNAVIHGITVLLNTPSTSKSWPCRMDIIRCNRSEDEFSLCFNGESRGLGAFIFEFCTITEVKPLSVADDENLYIYILEGGIHQVGSENDEICDKGDFMTIIGVENKTYNITPEKYAKVIILRAKTLNEKALLLGSLAMNTQDEINEILDKYRGGIL